MVRRNRRSGGREVKRGERKSTSSFKGQQQFRLVLEKKANVSELVGSKVNE